MGLFGFFKKRKTSSKSDQAFLEAVKQSMHETLNSQPDAISSEDYMKLRESEAAWLESHYDFNSIDGVNAIPVRKHLARPPGDSVTGDVYYYLKAKAYEHEKAGNTEVAIACFRKSITLMKLKFGATHGREESYSFVRMLARNGYLDEAKAEKASTDKFYATTSHKEDLKRFKQVRMDAKSLQTDLVIMSVHGLACSECAKYQGRVFSLSGKSRIFPKIPDVIIYQGCLHSDCSHIFHPYIHGINDPDLSYTLSVHPLQNKQYGEDIIAFSNRPFIDDRTPDYQRQAHAAHEKMNAEVAKKQQNDDDMIEREYSKWLDQQTVNWLQEICPKIAPKSVTSYRRMRTKNTKNYQILKQRASELGKEI